MPGPALKPEQPASPPSVFSRRMTSPQSSANSAPSLCHAERSGGVQMSVSRSRSIHTASTPHKKSHASFGVALKEHEATAPDSPAPPLRAHLPSPREGSPHQSSPSPESSLAA